MKTAILELEYFLTHNYKYSQNLGFLGLRDLFLVYGSK